jgi:NAD(P)-dependent dehydrogenase (short-subunit alcohol dehydrogenase family)
MTERSSTDSEWDGRVAVLTGAASGIGLAMARRFGAAGMRLALADVEPEALELASKELAGEGIETIQIVTDVSDADQMDRLAARVRDELGDAYLICLNAGISGGGGPLETLTVQDWKWGIGVNLWGVIHGLRVFLGDLKARDAGHIVITSSIAGLINSPQAGPYHATKHAVASIAEVLYRELFDAGSQVQAHCLCPGLVASNFPSGDRNRPAELQNPGADQIPAEAIEAMHKAVQEIFDRGVTAEHVAACVFGALEEGRFWIYTDEVHKQVIRDRHRAIEQGESPPTEGGALDGY